MHLVAKSQSWDPFPPVRHHEDSQHRRSANRAVAVSAVGLCVTGLLEMAIAILSGSAGLLGDALHNLADVSTSLVVFVGFWAWHGLTDIHQVGRSPGKDVQNGDCGKEASSPPFVHPGVQG